MLVDDTYLIIDKQSYYKNIILQKVVIDSGLIRLDQNNIKAFLKIVRHYLDYFIEWFKYKLPNKKINSFYGSKSNGLIIHSKCQKSNIIQLFRKYISSYVRYIV